MNELTALKHTAEKAANTVNRALLDETLIPRSERGADWEEVYYSDGALNDRKWARYVAAAPVAAAALSDLRQTAVEARAAYRAALAADKARKAAGIKLARPQAPIPAVSVTDVRRSGPRGEGITAVVNGELRAVRKSGGAKYAYVGVQVNVDGRRVYLSANRTPKVSPYNSYWRVVAVLPVP